MSQRLLWRIGAMATDFTFKPFDIAVSKLHKQLGEIQRIVTLAMFIRLTEHVVIFLLYTQYCINFRCF